MPRITMNQLPVKPSYDVVVSGAGPTGMTTALALRNSMRADGGDPHILVTDQRGAIPTRFQVLNLKPDAAATLRDNGLGTLLDGTQTIPAKQGWWLSPIKSIEGRLRAEAEAPGSGIDVLYDVRTTGIKQAADGTEQLRLEPKVAGTAGADDAARSAGATVGAKLLTVVAEGGGSSTARDLLGIPRHDDDVAANMVVGRFARDADYTAAHGDDHVRRWLFRDSDGTGRTMVAIDMPGHGTTGMLQVPDNTTPDQGRELLERHAAAIGLKTPLEEGPTMFEARGAIADRAIASPDRRVIVVGDYNGASTPNSGSNFGTDVAVDVPAAVQLTRKLQQAAGASAADRAARATAMQTYDAGVIAAHRQHMIDGRASFAGQPNFRTDWGPELPAPQRDTTTGAAQVATAA